MARTSGKYIRGIMSSTIRKSRRETVYKMVSKRNAGRVPCFVCKTHVEKPDATLEHVIPRSKGGTDDMSNLAISHGKCNNQRGNAVSV